MIQKSSLGGEKMHFNLDTAVVGAYVDQAPASHAP